jgi:23S rRNA pseudouridine955/2504/2580 synthase
MVEFKIGQDESSQRLDRFVRKFLSKAPHSLVYKLIRKKDIKVNGKRARIDYILKEEDRVTLYLSEDRIALYRQDKKHQPTLQKLRILYEDEQIVLVNKPDKIAVQPDQTKQVSLVDMLLDHCGYDPNSTFRPAFCNRLDKNTTGIVIGAKTLHALQMINLAIREKKIRKTYRALVVGDLREPLDLEAYLERNQRSRRSQVFSNKKDDSKKIKTRITPVYNEGGFTEIEVDLVTGRTHQIRAHLQHIHHPIIGDLKYGGRYQGVNSQMLHAHRVEFLELAGKMNYLNGKSFEASFPESYLEVKKRLFSKSIHSE